MGIDSSVILHSYPFSSCFQIRRPLNLVKFVLEYQTYTSLTFPITTDVRWLLACFRFPWSSADSVSVVCPCSGSPHSPLSAWLSPKHGTPSEQSWTPKASRSPKRLAFLEPESSSIQILQAMWGRRGPFASYLVASCY